MESSEILLGPNFPGTILLLVRCNTICAENGVPSSTMPQLVTGYHGCHRDAAKEIVKGATFLPSQNGYDWLGEGIYFWEDGPSRMV